MLYQLSYFGGNWGGNRTLVTGFAVPCLCLSATQSCADSWIRTSKVVFLRHVCLSSCTISAGRKVGSRTLIIGFGIRCTTIVRPIYNIAAISTRGQLRSVAPLCCATDNPCSPTWTRTKDILLNRKALYQLSYWGMAPSQGSAPRFPGSKPGELLLFELGMAGVWGIEPQIYTRQV